MSAAEECFEFATESDPSRNYCLWSYPRPSPAEDKFRAINLLLHAFEQAGALQGGRAIVEAIRDEIGPFQTVFGIKLIEGHLAWEFYFYDYQRRGRSVSMTRVLAAIRPFLAVDFIPDENVPYFMFSIDIDPGKDAATEQAARALEVVHAYIGNPGSTVSSGIAYAVRAGSIRLENFYFFFDAAGQRAEVADKIASSPHFDATQLSIDAVLLPEVRECRTICVANKQLGDCIYFSGIDVDQLVWFLTRFGYPLPLVDFVMANRGNLDHLLFDVGFDYCAENGGVRVLKSGYYGVF